MVHVLVKIVVYSLINNVQLILKLQQQKTIKHCHTTCQTILTQLAQISA